VALAMENYGDFKVFYER